MRLFAAVYPPAPAVSSLTAVLGEPDATLRYVPVDQWHITTAFYGDVAEEAVPELTDRLGRAAARSPEMTLRLTGAGTFPQQASRARMLWVGVAGDVGDLTRLAERCVAAGRRTGLAMEERRYRPHLTIARARRGGVDLRETVQRLAAYDGTPWPVTSLRLVRSTVGAVVRHETFAEWPLAS